MGKRDIGIILIISMIMTGLPWAGASYAAETDDILTETFETVPDEGYVEDTVGSDEVVSETVRTTPVEEDSEDEGERPDGVVKMTLKTTAVADDHEAVEEEIRGSSSMPDPAELGIYNEDVINMVMPVIPEDTYDFVLDAQDLLSRFSVYRDAYTPSSLYFTNADGDEISHSGLSDVAMAVNKSSVPVLLYVTLEVENEYGWPVTYTDMDSVEDDEENNLSFALIPVSSNKIETEDTKEAEEEADEGSDEEDAGEDNGYTLLEDQMINVDENGRARMVLYLDGTKDNFDIIADKYMAKEDAVWSSLGFAVTGACNRQADWKEMDKRSAEGENISIHISYRMDTLTEEQQAMIDEGLTPDPLSGVINFETEE
ncbi:MAG: hypothetical protein K5857_04085 [Lachnospiraceae bacterium]|nr:hypothetical protein [Lachnospiraceae bacterium]